jgi:hypothetical protein
MSTPTIYSKVYTVFQSNISDVEFNNLDETTLDGLQKQYLINSISKFRRCLQDLNDRSDDDNTFNIELTEDEMQILGNLMVVEYLSSQVVNLNNIKQFMSNKDFNLTSQANHLDKLLLLEDKRKKAISKMIVDYCYTFSDLSTLR